MPQNEADNRVVLLVVHANVPVCHNSGIGGRGLFSMTSTEEGAAEGKFVIPNSR